MTENYTNSSLLINESPMQLLPSLAGILNEDGALFLQQLHFWLYYSKNVKDGRKWIFNTLDEWNCHFFWWSKSKLQRIIASLKNFTYEDETYHILLVGNFNVNRLNQRKWFTIDYDELRRLEPIAVRERIRLKKKLVERSKVLQDKLQSSEFIPPQLRDLTDFADVLPVCPIVPKEPPSTPGTVINLYSQKDKYVPDFEVKSNSQSLDGQNDHVEISKSQTPSGQNDHVAKNNGSEQYLPPSGQNDHVEMVKMTSPSGQNDILQMVKMTSSTLVHKNTSTLANSHLPAPKEQKDKDDDERLNNKSELIFIQTKIQDAGIRVRKIDQALLLDLYKQYGYDTMLSAIETAKRYNAKTCAYLQTILENPLPPPRKESKPHGKGKQRYQFEASNKNTTGNNRMDETFKKYGF